MAALVTRLLTESCLNETKAVLQSGQSQSLQLAFEGLGQYVDQKRFTEALTAK
jgi:hypothetical protein